MNGPLPEAEFEKLFAEKMQEAKQADDARAFVQAYNTAHRDLEADEDERLQAAVEAYEALDEQLAPGGIFANLPASEKLRLTTAVHRDHGSRPELLSPEEILANERAEAAAESARMKAELEQFNADTLAQMNYASLDDMRAGNKMPVPSLIETADGVPAWLMPDGSVVEQYAAAFGKTARNPRFAEVASMVKRTTGSR